MSNVDRREVVQVLAIFFSPSMGLLSISILVILLPPDFFREPQTESKTSHLGSPNLPAEERQPVQAG